MSAPVADSNPSGLRVLFLAPMLEGGVGSHFSVLAKELESRGIRTAAHAVKGNTRALESSCTLGATVGGTRKLAELLSRHRFDVIHATSGIAGHNRIAKAINTFAAHAAIVLVSHGSQSIDLERFPRHAVGAVSAAAKSVVIGADQNEIPVIPNATDGAIFYSDSSGAAVSGDRPKVIWIGRTLDADWQCKDVWGFLMFIASPQSEGMRFLLIDSQDRRAALGLNDWLSNRAEYQYGLSPTTMGETLRKAAAENGCLLFTSRSEGMPMTLLEAWASGLPVIAPRSPGFEMVNDRVDGLLYDRSSSFPGVRQRIENASDAATREAIIAGGLNRTRTDCSATLMADRYLELYGRAIQRATKAHGALRERFSQVARALLRTTARVIRPA